jgi:hypothetical protein
MADILEAEHKRHLRLWEEVKAAIPKVNKESARLRTETDARIARGPDLSSTQRARAFLAAYQGLRFPTPKVVPTWETGTTEAIPSNMVRPIALASAPVPTMVPVSDPAGPPGYRIDRRGEIVPTQSSRSSVDHSPRLSVVSRYPLDERGSQGQLSVSRFASRDRRHSSQLSVVDDKIFGGFQQPTYERRNQEQLSVSRNLPSDTHGRRSSQLSVVGDRGFGHEFGEEENQSASSFARPSRYRQPSQLSVTTDENIEDSFEEDGTGHSYLRLRLRVLADPPPAVRGPVNRQPRDDDGVSASTH